MQALFKCVLFTIIIPSVFKVNKRLQHSETVESNGYLPKVPWFKYEVLYFLHLDTVFLVNIAARG